MTKSISADSSVWSGDSNYHRRHCRRSLKRAERIGCHLVRANTLLDVGCNEGLVSEYLLRMGKADFVTGIEMSDAKLSNWLKESAHFELINASVEDVAFERRYDCIFYGAVHHHIVRESGITTAVKIFQKLAHACDDRMFFETGQLGEGGRWEWQRALAKYFSNDEEHFWYLLRSVEPILKSFKVIGQYYIHGVPRYLCEISFKSQGDETKDFDFSVGGFDEIQRFRRMDGSKAFKLESDRQADSLSPTFKRLEQSGQYIFTKQRPLLPHVDLTEYQIGSQLDFSWAVRPLGYSDAGIVFPWVEGKAIAKEKGFSGSLQRQLIAQLDTIMRDAKRRRVDLQPSLLVGCKRRSTFDVIDFNINNYLLVGEELKVVDFEFFSDVTRSRNYINFANVYYRLGARVPACKYYSYGLLGMLAESAGNSIRPFEVRVVRRSPSLLSWLHTLIRSRTGRLLIRLFPFLSEK